MNNQDHKKIKSFFDKKLKDISLNEELIETTISSLVEASLFGIDSHGVNLFEHYTYCPPTGCHQHDVVGKPQVGQPTAARVQTHSKTTILPTLL